MLKVRAAHSSVHKTSLFHSLIWPPYLHGWSRESNLPTRSGEVVLDRRHLEVVTAGDDGATDVDAEVAAAGRDRLLRDLPVHVLDLLGEAGRVLVAWQVLVVEGDLAACHHGDLDAMVSAEPVEQSLESQAALVNLDLVVVGVAFRQASNRAAHDRVKLLGLVLDDIVGLGHHDGGQGQVDEGVLELGDVIEVLHELVNLVADNTSDHGGGGGDGRDDLTCNHLGLVAIALGDLVVAGAKIGSSIDEINVEVIVIILLEIGWHKSSLDGLLANLKLLEQLSNDRLVIVIGSGATRCGSSGLLASFLLLRGLDSDHLTLIFLGWKASNNALALSLVNCVHA